MSAFVKRIMSGTALYLVLLSIQPVAIGEELGDFYVAVPVLNERTAPVDGAVVNRIYEGQKVTVYAVEDGWALVSPPGYESRWVSYQYLLRDKPAAPEAPAIEKALADPRIAPSAIPRPGEYGLSEWDVEILWRGAAKFLENGRCNHIEYADKSTSKENTYFVNCGGQNVFFTPSEVM